MLVSSCGLIVNINRTVLQWIHSPRSYRVRQLQHLACARWHPCWTPVVYSPVVKPRPHVTAVLIPPSHVSTVVRTRHEACFRPRSDAFRPHIDRRGLQGDASQHDTHTRSHTHTHTHTHRQVIDIITEQAEARRATVASRAGPGPAHPRQSPARAAAWETDDDWNFPDGESSALNYK